jgi:exonuclease SbcC
VRRLIIHRLHILGFKMLADLPDLEFPEFGRIGIFGRNESGKSTLMEAVEYGLFGLKRGAKPGEEREDIITWGKGKANIKLEFSSGEARYEIDRTMGPNTHVCQLTPIVAGVRDTQNALRSINAIQSKVEEIVGMDRESFSKLVYVRQKDLDALKELYKSRREELVNKVMGIDIFDRAAGYVRDDEKSQEKRLDELHPRLEAAKRNSELFEQKTSEKVQLESTVAFHWLMSESTRSDLEGWKARLQALDWVKSSSVLGELLASKQIHLESVQSLLKRLSDAESRKLSLEQVYQKLRPKAEELMQKKRRLEELEYAHDQMARRLDEARSTYSQVQASSAMTSSELESARRAAQPTRLTLSVLLLVAGAVTTVTAALSQPLLALVGLPIVVMGAYLYVRHSQATGRLKGVSALRDAWVLVEDAKKSLQKATQELDDYRDESGCKSSNDVSTELVKLNDEFRLLTGIDSVEGAGAMLSTYQDEINQLDKKELMANQEDLTPAIEQTKMSLGELEGKKPLGTEGLSFDESRHQEASRIVQNLTEDLEWLSREREANRRLLQQLDADLAGLEADHEEFPKLQRQVEECETTLRLLERTSEELAETSRDLRARVIPHARYIINRILPLMTDGRYSDLEITEDLKFKVHSIEAGAYKERELFSGGTQDQFLIALRLAFTQSVLDSRVRADRYCLLLDECISSSDPARKQGIFEVLDGLKDTFCQIFVIAHEDISPYVSHYIVLERNEAGQARIRTKNW